MQWIAVAIDDQMLMRLVLGGFGPADAGHRGQRQQREQRRTCLGTRHRIALCHQACSVVAAAAARGHAKLVAAVADATAELGEHAIVP